MTRIVDGAAMTGISLQTVRIGELLLVPGSVICACLAWPAVARPLPSENCIVGMQSSDGTMQLDAKQYQHTFRLDRIDVPNWGNRSSEH